MTEMTCMVDPYEFAQRVNEALFKFANGNGLNADIKFGIFETVNQACSEQPTVLAAPVSVGHWVHCEGKTQMWHCSECGEVILYNENPRTYYYYHKTKRKVHECNKFCRNCGAKMGPEILDRGDESGGVAECGGQ